MESRKTVLIGIAAALSIAATVQDSPPVMTPQTSGTTARLVAVSAANINVVWASGERGTYVRTVDGGTTWTAAQVPGAERLDFRDVHAVDDKVAYLLAAGDGDKSRIYKTVDGGANWRLQFTNKDSAGFYDCFDFWDSEHGVVAGDAINGELAILTTSNGGMTWTRVPPAPLPPALGNEGSFASSGTCLVTGSGGKAWIGTTKSRVLRTTDFGKTWKVALTPITAHDSGGIPSIAMRDDKNGLAFGGYGYRDGATMLAATSDGGANWEPRTRPAIKGGAYAGAYVISAIRPTVMVVGPSGSAYSRDHGQTWIALDTLNYWGLTFVKGNRGWAVGRNGRITRFTGF